MAKKKLTNNDVYERVTRRILEALDKSEVLWSKPWSTGIWHPPQNLISKRPYRGFNVFSTMSTIMGLGYSSPYFVSYKQAQQLGGNVKRGECSTCIMFWKFLKVKDKETGEDKQIPMARYSSVFNIEQCEGIDESKIPATAKPEEFEHDPIESAVAIQQGWADCPTIKHGGDRAAYSPSEDRIMMPALKRFKTAENYHHTLFHEMVHSTGHESRLNRRELKDGRFGNEPYSVEELTAEAGACLLAARAGIQFEVEQSAAYINGWCKKLGDDPKIIVQAFSRAQKAADLILNESSAAISTDVDDYQPAEVVAA